MKARELSELDADELATRLAEAKEELFNLRFQHVTSQLDNPNRLREVRQDIARIFTVIRQRELAGDPVPAAVASGKPVRAPRKRHRRTRG